MKDARGCKDQVDFIRGYLDRIAKTSRKEIDMQNCAAYHSGRLDLAIDLLGLIRKLERAIEETQDASD